MLRVVSNAQVARLNLCSNTYLLCILACVFNSSCLSFPFKKMRVMIRIAITKLEALLGLNVLVYLKIEEYPVYRILFHTIYDFKRLPLLAQYSRHGIIWCRILQEWTHSIFPSVLRVITRSESPWHLGFFEGKKKSTLHNFPSIFQVQHPDPNCF